MCARGGHLQVDGGQVVPGVPVVWLLLRGAAERLRRARVVVLPSAHSSPARTSPPGAAGSRPGPAPSAPPPAKGKREADQARIVVVFQATPNLTDS